MRACNCARASPFQSTHPRGVRHDDLPVLPPLRPRFNPRTRVGCDLTSITCGCLRDGGFNPRTRVGCDLSGQPLFCRVSSFNPRTRVGCDGFQGRGLTGQRCFNPRTRVGCDWDAGRKTRCDACFNPRTRVGCDAGRVSALVDAAAVSIHAPAWGATKSSRTRRSHERGFNPRTRVGCDRHDRWIDRRQRGFNPRTRVGCDRPTSRHPS